jgi:hypothetical protein
MVTIGSAVLAVLAVACLVAGVYLRSLVNRGRARFAWKMTRDHLRAVARVLRGVCPCGCATMGPGFRLRLLWDHPKRDGYREGFRGKRV